MVNEQLERKIIALVATDRVEIPISSMSGKLKRRKPKLGESIDADMKSPIYVGERVYARVEEDNKEKARTMKEAVKEFCDKYTREGNVLQGIIAEKRLQKEKHLYFGMQDSKRLTREDYMEVVQDLGYSPALAESLYESIIDASRNISKKRDEERALLIGKTTEED